MKLLLFVTSFILVCFNLTGQEYKSFVMIDDTITEGGHDIVYFDDYFYTMSLTKCQPDAQSCALLRKFDRNLDLLWALYFPQTRKSNENGINILNDSTLIIVGRNNTLNDQQAFYHHTVNTDGQILDFIEHPLPYESNITLGSYLHNNVLYMFGTSREFLSTTGIDVDALIVSHDINTNQDELDYFDYGNNFYVDIYDLQNNSDTTLVFISRRRNFDYSSERDYVIEEIQPDGSRIELYNVKVPNETGIKDNPSLEVLSDGRIAFFKTDETDFGTSRTIRILNSSGDFLQDIIIWDQIFPDVSTHYNLTSTNDGGFVISGQYIDRTMSDDESQLNGMLLKVDKEGELEWVRQYKHYHNGTGEPTRSFLFDVKELPNGDIIATGNVENITNDLWVIKTNSEGCLGDGDCGETTVSIEEEIFQRSYINVYPNPVISGKNLQVEVSSQVSGRVDYQLIDMQGRTVHLGQMVSGINMVSTSGFASGSYVLNIDLGVRGLESKVVIVK